MKEITERLLFTPPKYYHGTIIPMNDSGITKLISFALSEADVIEKPYSKQVLELIDNPVMIFPDGRQSDGNLIQLANGMITHDLALEYYLWYKNAIQESEILKLFQLSQFYKYDLSADLNRLRNSYRNNSSHRGLESSSDSSISRVNINKFNKNLMRLKKVGNRFTIASCYLPQIGDEIEVLQNVGFLAIISCLTESIKANFEKFVNLSVLNLSGNRLQTLPESLFAIPRLTFLNISNNYIEDLGSTIPTWVGIKKLILDDNRLQYMPSWLNKLDNLEVLSISSNPLKSLKSIDGLVNLKELEINHVPDTIDIDPAIMDLPHLSSVRFNPDLIDKINNTELANWFRKHHERHLAYQKQLKDRDPNPMNR